MAIHHKWDVKNGFAYVLTFFSLISDGLGSVHSYTGHTYLRISISISVTLDKMLFTPNSLLSEVTLTSKSMHRLYICLGIISSIFVHQSDLIFYHIRRGFQSIQEVSQNKCSWTLWRKSALQMLW